MESQTLRRAASLFARKAPTSSRGQEDDHLKNNLKAMTTHPSLTKAAIVQQVQNIAEDFSLGPVDCQYSGKNKTMYVSVHGDISPFELKAGPVKIKFQTKP